jgi:hypothetical protein
MYLVFSRLGHGFPLSEAVPATEVAFPTRNDWHAADFRSGASLWHAVDRQQRTSKHGARASNKRHPWSVSTAPSLSCKHKNTWDRTRRRRLLHSTLKTKSRRTIRDTRCDARLFCCLFTYRTSLEVRLFFLASAVSPLGFTVHLATPLAASSCPSTTYSYIISFRFSSPAFLFLTATRTTIGDKARLARCRSDSAFACGRSLLDAFSLKQLRFCS